MKTIKTLNALLFTTAVLVLLASCSSSSNDEEPSKATSFQVKGVSYDITQEVDSGIVLNYVGDFEQFGGISIYALTISGANNNLTMVATVEFELIVKQGTSPFGNYSIIDSDEGNASQTEVDADITATLDANGRFIFDGDCFVAYFDESSGGSAIAHYPSEGLLMNKDSDGITSIRYTGSQFKRFDNNTGDVVETVDVSINIKGTLLEILD